MVNSKRERFSSTPLFIFTAVGMAVGLGNIWRFPYIMGSSGGSGFLFLYIAFIFGISLPLMIMEFAVGRQGQGDVVSSFKNVAKESNASTKWAGLGVLGVVINVLVMSFYFVIAGWTLAYIPRVIEIAKPGLTASMSQLHFDSLLSNPFELIFWQTVAIAIIVFVLSRGLKGGIEKAMKYLMSALFLILLMMVAISLSLGDFSKTFSFLFSFKPEEISKDVVLAALGQAFFTVGVGSGMGVIFGSYLEKDVSIVKSALIVVSADTFVAVLAGLAIYPIMFAQGVSPESGPDLVFITLPLLFSELQYGQFIGLLFMLLLAIAAISSAIAISEVPISWISEKLKMSRVVATLVYALGIWLLGLMTVFSFNTLADFFPLGFLATYSDKTMFDIIDYACTHLLFPIGGLGLVIFCGFALKKEILMNQIMPAGVGNFALFNVAYIIFKYLLPLILIALLLL
jgi:NSS family neurotransmitter:Na+ symporter